MHNTIARELPHTPDLERWLVRVGHFLSRAITAAVEGCRQEVGSLLEQYPDIFQRLGEPLERLDRWEANRRLDHLLDGHFARTRGVRAARPGVFGLPTRLAAPKLTVLEVFFNSAPEERGLQGCVGGMGYVCFRLHDFWPLVGSPDLPAFGGKVRPEVAAVVFRDLELLAQEMTHGPAGPVDHRDDLERLADGRWAAATCRGLAAQLFFSQPSARRFDLAAARAILPVTSDAFTLLRAFDHPRLKVSGRAASEVFAAACRQTSAALASLRRHPQSCRRGLA